MATYAKLDAMLQGRNREWRKLANNTYAERRWVADEENQGVIAVTLYWTDIGKFFDDGACVLNTGGWRTVTTKRRLNNDVLGRDYPFGIWSERGEWYIGKGYDKAKARIFADGMTVWPDGQMKGAMTAAQGKVRAKIARDIVRYVDGYMKALATGKVAAPGSGDCLYCLMRVQPEGSGGTMTGVLMPSGLTRAATCKPAMTGKTLGEQNENTSHLLSHFKERYYVGSLLVRAGEVFPVSKAAQWWLGSFWDSTTTQEREEGMGRFADIAERQWRSSLRRYLRRQFKLA